MELSQQEGQAENQAGILVQAACQFSPRAQANAPSLSQQLLSQQPCFEHGAEVHGAVIRL